MAKYPLGAEYGVEILLRLKTDGGPSGLLCPPPCSSGGGARHILRDHQEAEVVVQQTYLNAFTKIVYFRGEANLRTWMTRIALNETLWRERRQRLQVELGKIDTVQERVRSQIYLSPMMQATPEGEAARSQIRRVLEGAIDDLRPAFRTVLVMLG